jgi:predicted small secreted protein
MMAKKFMMILVLSGGLVLSACNAVRGAADDVESVGDCADSTENNC